MKYMIVEKSDRFIAFGGMVGGGEIPTFTLRPKGAVKFSTKEKVQSFLEEFGGDWVNDCVVVETWIGEVSE